jgi:hypothetical protein
LFIFFPHEFGQIIVGGDFNFTKKVSEYNKQVVLGKWTQLFNAIIEHGELKEVKIVGRRYTWSNNHHNTTLRN